MFINNMEQYTEFEKHIDDDYYCDNPKFKCLVAEVDGKAVGMILYSFFLLGKWWASFMDFTNVYRWRI